MRPMIVMRMEPTNESLARAAAEGDDDAFAALLERHYNGIFRLAFRLTGRRADAEDLTQDVCTALPAKLQSFHGEARMTTWLWRVVVNAAHDRRRRAATYAKNAEGWGEWEVNRRAAQVEEAAAADWLTQAMHGLPEDLRDTLALVLDDMTHEEAGQVLDVSAGTISWRISEAKKRLRAMREKEDQV